MNTDAVSLIFEEFAMRALFVDLFILSLVFFFGALFSAEYWWAVGAALMVCVSLIGRILAN